MEKKIVGYADEISVAPGERIRFMVSCEGGIDRYRADIVRLISGDTQPDGPGYRDEPLDSAASGEYPGREQPTHAGAYALVPHASAFVGLLDITVQLMVYPTLPDARRACLLSKTDAAVGKGFALWTDPQAGLVLTLGDANRGMHEFALGRPMIAREWYLVSASYDNASREICLTQRRLSSHARDTSAGEAHHRCEEPAVLDCDAPLLIAANASREVRSKPVPEAVFNGRIERPVVARRVLAAHEIETLRYGPVPASLAPVVCAAWDFSREMSSDRIVDLSPNRLHGELVNLPIRAVRGSAWTGEEMNFRHAPEQYAAIHFLEDGIYDCGWEPDFELEVPVGTRSGVYAAHLVAGDQEDHIPFVVRPPRDAATAPLALLIPTASYMAYANKRGVVDAAGMEVDSNRLMVVEPEDRYLNLHPELGNSMYDLHADGTGVCYSSRLRPILDLRPKHGSLWGFSADLHITDWLEREQVAYDVITDEDMHADGRDPARALPLRDDLHASRVLLDPDVGRDLPLHPSRWTAHVPRRQRLLLAGRLPRRQAGGDGDAPRRGWLALLGLGAGRVPHVVHRGVRRVVVALRAGAAGAGRQRLHRPRGSTFHPTTGASPTASIHGSDSSSKGSARTS